MSRCTRVADAVAFVLVAVAIMVMLPPPVSSQNPADRVFLCGFRPNQQCQFDLETRCQEFIVGTCNRFTSAAFREFGLVEIFARITSTQSQSDRRYSYRVFSNADCTGNPFGFEVFGNNMQIGECRPLSIPFVGNQVDFMFIQECDQCTNETLILLSTTSTSPSFVTTSSSTTAVDGGGGDDEDAFAIHPDATPLDYPTHDGLVIEESVPGEQACELLGLQSLTGENYIKPTMQVIQNSNGLELAWSLIDGQDVFARPIGTTAVVYRTLWCNGTSLELFRQQPKLLTGTITVYPDSLPVFPVEFETPFVNTPWVAQAISRYDSTLAIIEVTPTGFLVALRSIPPAPLTLTWIAAPKGVHAATFASPVRHPKPGTFLDLVRASDMSQPSALAWRTSRMTTQIPVGMLSASTIDDAVILWPGAALRDRDENHDGNMRLICRIEPTDIGTVSFGLDHPGLKPEYPALSLIGDVPSYLLTKSRPMVNANDPWVSFHMNISEADTDPGTVRSFSKVPTPLTMSTYTGRKESTLPTVWLCEYPSQVACRTAIPSLCFKVIVGDCTRIPRSSVLRSTTYRSRKAGFVLLTFSDQGGYLLQLSEGTGCLQPQRLDADPWSTELDTERSSFDLNKCHSASVGFEAPSLQPATGRVFLSVRADPASRLDNKAVYWERGDIVTWKSLSDFGYALDGSDNPRKPSHENRPQPGSRWLIAELGRSDELDSYSDHDLAVSGSSSNLTRDDLPFRFMLPPGKWKIHIRGACLNDDGEIKFQLSNAEISHDCSKSGPSFWWAGNFGTITMPEVVSGSAIKGFPSSMSFSSDTSGFALDTILFTKAADFDIPSWVFGFFQDDLSVVPCSARLSARACGVDTSRCHWKNSHCVDVAADSCDSFEADACPQSRCHVTVTQGIRGCHSRFASLNCPQQGQTYGGLVLNGTLCTPLATETPLAPPEAFRALPRLWTCGDVHMAQISARDGIGGGYINFINFTGPPPLTGGDDETPASVWIQLRKTFRSTLPSHTRALASLPLAVAAGLVDHVVTLPTNLTNSLCGGPSAVALLPIDIWPPVSSLAPTSSVSAALACPRIVAMHVTSLIETLISGFAEFDVTPTDVENLRVEVVDVNPPQASFDDAWLLPLGEWRFSSIDDAERLEATLRISHRDGLCQPSGFHFSKLLSPGPVSDTVFAKSADGRVLLGWNYNDAVHPRPQRFAVATNDQSTTPIAMTSAEPLSLPLTLPASLDAESDDLAHHPCRSRLSTETPENVSDPELQQVLTRQYHVELPLAALAGQTHLHVLSQRGTLMHSTGIVLPSSFRTAAVTSDPVVTVTFCKSLTSGLVSVEWKVTPDDVPPADLAGFRVEMRATARTANGEAPMLIFMVDRSERRWTGANLPGSTYNVTVQPVRAGEPCRTLVRERSDSCLKSGHVAIPVGKPDTSHVLVDPMPLHPPEQLKLSTDEGLNRVNVTVTMPIFVPITNQSDILVRIWPVRDTLGNPVSPSFVTDQIIREPAAETLFDLSGALNVRLNSLMPATVYAGMAAIIQDDRQSLFSDKVEFTTPGAVPDAPTGVQAVRSSVKSIQLGWKLASPVRADVSSITIVYTEVPDKDTQTAPSRRRAVVSSESRVTVPLTAEMVSRAASDTMSVILAGVRPSASYILALAVNSASGSSTNSSIATAVSGTALHFESSTLQTDNPVSEAALAISVICTLLVCGLVLFGWHRYKRRREQMRNVSGVGRSNAAWTLDQWIAAVDELFAERFVKAASTMSLTRPQLQDLNNTQYEISNFDLQAVLHAGSFGTVRHAKVASPDVNAAGSDVAVRVLSVSSRDAQVLQRQQQAAATMLLEAQILSSLSCDSIVTILGINISTDRVIVAQEYMSQGCLLDFLHTPTAAELPLPKLAQFVLDVVNAMAALEAHHIYHGDLRCANVLISGGLGQEFRAKLHRAARSEQPPDAAVRWQAPEVLAGRGASLFSDRWSFGVTVWEILSLGTPPFSAVAEPDLALYLRKSPELYLKADRSDFQSVVDRCLDADPVVRPLFSDLASQVSSALSALMLDQATPGSDAGANGARDVNGQASQSTASNGEAASTSLMHKYRMI